ncbi:MAG: TVP38/TMEM64 family protein [Oscillospiraceae bacterium]
MAEKPTENSNVNKPEEAGSASSEHGLSKPAEISRSPETAEANPDSTGSQDSSNTYPSEEQPVSKLTAFLRIVGIVVSITVVVLLVYLFLVKTMPGLIDAIRSGDEGAIEEYLRHENLFWGLFTVFFLQYVQILSVFLPGPPIQIASGLVFGKWLGFAVCYVACILANLTLFWLSRKLGKSLSAIFHSRNNYDKIVNKVLSSPSIGVVILCLLPVIPNGMVPIFASKTDITLTKFLISIGIGYIPTLFVFAAVGDLIISGNYLVSILLCIALGSLSVIIYLYRNKILEFTDKIGDKLARRKNNKKK